MEGKITGEIYKLSRCCGSMFILKGTRGIYHAKYYGGGGLYGRWEKIRNEGKGDNMKKGEGMQAKIA